MKFNWATFPKWHDSDTETMKDILAWVTKHKAELREMSTDFNLTNWQRKLIKEILGE